MAGLSFLDLMLAEALAGGLAREQARRERPPPDNVFVLPKELRAWNQIKEACRKENMVFLVDITDGTSENCKRVDNIFFDMAREFDGLPFFLVKVGPFGTFDQLRQDLGGIQYTPTLLIGFYGARDALKRAKYEGEAEIRQGLSSGQLKRHLKEFREMRAGLKVMEHVAGEMAQHVTEKEQQIRREYELKMKRELAEKEEKDRKEAEDKKRQEEEQQRKKDELLKKRAETRREERPQHLEELLRMDLDTCSIRDIKAIMIKMGISHHDCFERADLKKKLIANVPELRIATERKESISSRRNVSSIGSSSSGLNNLDSPLTNSMDELNLKLSHEKQAKIAIQDENTSLQTKITTLEQQLRSKETELGKKDMELQDKNTILQREITSLKQQLKSKETELGKKDLELKSLRERGNSSPQAASLKSGRPEPKPKPRSRTVDNSQVAELKTQLLETRMLYTTTIEDYNVLRVIHDAGEEGLVLSVTCERPNIPTKNRVYAMKVLTDYFHTQTQTQVRAQFQNEYQVLCQLPPHENIIHMWAFFFDRVNPDVIPQFRSTGKNARTMSLFLLMDQHSMSMQEQISSLVDNRGPAPNAVVRWFKQLLNALVFLEKNCVVHRDLKLDNLLLSSNGILVVSDFGKAVLLDDNFTIPYMHGTDAGGNNAHLAPEVLNARPGPRGKINYSKQPVWAAGVLGYELAGHCSPFQKGTIDQRGYSIGQVPPLNDTYCKHTRYCQPLPQALGSLVRSMLEPEARDRPSLVDCLARLDNV